MTRPLSQTKHHKARRRWYAKNRMDRREYNNLYRVGLHREWWRLACIKAGVSPCEFEKPKPIFV